MLITSTIMIVISKAYNTQSWRCICNFRIKYDTNSDGEAFTPIALVHMGIKRVV